jgi:hypothetical protein
MSSNVISKLRGYKALLYLGKKVVLAKRNKIYLADMSLQGLEYKCSISYPNIIIRIISHFRLLQRLFRLELGPAIPLNEKGCFLIFYRNQLFHVNLALNRVKQEFIPGIKHRPLQLIKCKSPESYGVIYFGEYTPNFSFKSVNIYKRDLSGKWSIVFKFSKGQINHIHGIYEDVKRHCLYILTGDFDQAAGVWISNTSFGDVKPFVRSGQNSRACWIFPWGKRLIFATDKQDDYNYICEINNFKKPIVLPKFPIAGSSIFFSSTHTNKIIFSTAVEPLSNNYFSIKSLFISQHAKGILSNSSCVYAGTPEQGFQIVFSDKKDFWSYKLFQFGNISFPVGESSDSKYLHFYCTALKDSDNVTYAVKINRELV